MSTLSRLPPFSALRGFEAAARLNSFRLAAEELHLSPSAVSHHVRQLEEFIGQSLFSRGPRGVRLTREGKEYLSEVSEILEGLARATDKIRKKTRLRTVTLKCSPSFASRWMTPRLARLRRTLGSANVTLSTNQENTRPDIEIACGYTFPPDDEYETFMTTERAPVCSPEYLSEHGTIQSPADLVDHILLHENQHDEWGRWLNFAAPNISSPDHAMWFEDGYSATLAAESGAGIVLGHLTLIEKELRNGSLIQLFEQTTPQSTIYTLRMKPGWENDRKLSTLRKWLLEEAMPSAMAA